MFQMQDVCQSLYYGPLEVNLAQLSTPLGSPGLTEGQRVSALEITPAVRPKRS